jgi:hypothetical protein
MKLTEDRMTPMKRAVASFMEMMPAGSQVAVVAFDTRIRQISGFADDRRSTQEGVDALEAGGGTRFRDAVGMAIKLLEDEPGRRAILAMTDGIDTASEEESLESLIAAARRAGVPVHTLGVGNEEEIATRELEALAEGTRGRYFAAREAGDLQAIYEEVARGLGESYSLSYRSERLPDGTLRAIEVEYGANPQATGAAEVYVRGMVVPASGWNGLFLALAGVLVALAVAPGWLKRRRTATR